MSHKMKKSYREYISSSLQELLEQYQVFYARKNHNQLLLGNSESFENMSTVKRETLLNLVFGTLHW